MISKIRIHKETLRKNSDHIPSVDLELKSAHQRLSEVCQNNERKFMDFIGQKNSKPIKLQKNISELTRSDTNSSGTKKEPVSFTDFLNLKPKSGVTLDSSLTEKNQSFLNYLNDIQNISIGTFLRDSAGFNSHDQPQKNSQDQKDQFFLNAINNSPSEVVCKKMNQKYKKESTKNRSDSRNKRGPVSHNKGKDLISTNKKKTILSDKERSKKQTQKEDPNCKKKKVNQKDKRKDKQLTRKRTGKVQTKPKNVFLSHCLNKTLLSSSLKQVFLPSTKFLPKGS